jgi:hypothetical protein
LALAPTSGVIAAVAGGGVLVRPSHADFYRLLIRPPESRQSIVSSSTPRSGIVE